MDNHKVLKLNCVMKHKKKNDLINYIGNLYKKLK